ncbi:MAG: SsrA-binding protein SmpB [Candidatus Pacebacteria bacterium]|nr:SsrA-binding protein SmpB [Candidatus Paceibacterota bacterium]
MTTLAKNRKAFHDYEILEKFEAGIELQGTEVKSCRERNISLADAHARVDEDGEIWVRGVHIAPYKHGNRENHDPRRPRKLLLHKREIRDLKQATETKGMTLIPLRFYVKHRRVKVELGLCRGKARHDKRETMKRKIHEQEAKQAMAKHR